MTLFKSLALLYCGALLSTTAIAQQSYFQQEVNTRIEVRLDDTAHFLHGRETFTYKNNSPDTLRYLYIHLWPNAYSHDRTAFSRQMAENGKRAFYYARNAQRGYIDSLSFRVDDRDAGFSSEFETPDIARLDLPKPLLPGQTASISTPFRVKIPQVFSRLGHNGQAYFISQWFPKPAVYDRKGWHPIPYLDQGEFFSEIGTYDVSITLPKNYVVMATGNCTDADEHRFLQNRMAGKDTAGLGNKPASSAEMKTLHFTEKNVHDFAWFADKRWLVATDTFKNAGSTDTMVAYAAYLPQSRKAWRYAAGYLRQTVASYGTRVGPYPYRTIKAVQGDLNAGGGMEYPTVTVIDRGIVGIRDVVVHEAGHNWFYGILASNERDHAWMDEGFNTFYERKTVQWGEKDTLARRFSRGDDAAYYQAVATNTDQALENPSADFLYINYAGDVYVKTALLLQWLESYLGQDAYQAAMHEYYDTWKHKHPYPEDFEAIVRKHAGGKDVDWFFKNAILSDRPIDFAVKNISSRDGQTRITLKNRTPYAAPAGILLSKDKRLTLAQGLSGASPNAVDSMYWTAPFTGTATVTLPDSAWRVVSVSDKVPDSRPGNNTYNRGKLFKRLQGNLTVGQTIGNARSRGAFILPSLGFNEYDGFMAGLLLHNLTIPETRFRYVASVMYPFRAKSPVGAASVAYSFYPKGLQEITAGLDAKTFHYSESWLNRDQPLFARYAKAAPWLQFTFREPRLRSPVSRRLLLKGYAVYEEGYRLTQSATDSLFRSSIVSGNVGYGLIRYTHENNRTFNPFSYMAEVHGNGDFLKVGITGKARIDYHAPKKSLHARVYAGKFFNLTGSDNSYQLSRYYLNTTFTGANDYLYDDTYLGRNEREGFTAHQTSLREGGFRIATPLYANPIGRSDNWLVSLNLKSDLPLGKLPLRVFADVTTFADAARQNPSGSKALFAAGLEVHALGDMLTLSVPLVMSNDYRDYFKSIYGNAGPGRTYAFSINLNGIEWTKIQRTLLGMAVN